MERVWLSSTYYLDPRVSGLSMNAERLFVRSIAFCGGAETKGFIPISSLPTLGISRYLKYAVELVDAQLWEEVGAEETRKRSGSVPEEVRKSYGKAAEAMRKNSHFFRTENLIGFQLCRWSKWQKSGDDLLRKKELDRERKARSRNHQPDSVRGMSRDVTHTEERREEKNSKEFSSTTHLSNAGEEQPRGPAVPVDAWKLIRAVIPAEHPQAVKTDLALRAGALIKSGTPEPTVRAALELWLSKPNVGTGLLPSLVSEVIKSAAPLHVVNGSQPQLGPASQKAAGWLAVGQNLTNPQRHRELE